MAKKLWVMFFTGIVLLFIMGIGCSSNGPVAPTPDGNRGYDLPRMRTSDNQARELLGYWKMIYDVDARTITPIPLRTSSLHLNIREILEHDGPLIFLKINNLDDTALPIITIDIGLVHPFAGLGEFQGFDVRGIFISRGNWTGWDDSALRIPTANEPRLDNADGWTRWWNPTEFLESDGWFGYSDGLLGSPHQWQDFNSILNGYKLFADDLDLNESLDTLDVSQRALFSDGSENWRHYTIDFGKIMSNWIIFNYAVDACWEFPTGSPPYTLDSYPIETNSPEAYHIRATETNNTLFFDGYSGSGALGLDIDVFDWQNPGEVTAIQVEALELWSGPNYAIVVPGSGGPTYSTYHVDIPVCTPTHAGTSDVLISVPCYDWDYQTTLTNWPGTSQYGTYQLYRVDIGGSNCPPYAKVFKDGWQVDELIAPNSVPNRKCIWSDGMNVYVCWIDSRAGDPDVYFNKSADGGETWLLLDIRLTDDIPNRIQRYPQIAVSEDGQRICVIWDDQRYSPVGPTQDIDEPMYTISNDGGTTWSPNMSAKLGGIPNQQQFQPTICAKPNGAFYFAWIDEDVGGAGDKATVFARIPAASDVVDLNEIVEDKTGDNYFGAQDWKLDVAYDSNTDTIYVVWADTRNEYTGANTGVDVFIDKSTDGGATWGTDVKVNPDSTNTDQTHPTVEVGDSGMVYVAYIDEQGVDPVVAFVKSYSGGMSFTGYLTPDSLPGVHWYPDMARGGLENLFLVWQMDDTCYLTWSCDEGETWEIPQMIDPVENPDQVTSPAVYVGANQHVFVTARFRADTGQPSHVRVWRWE